MARQLQIKDGKAVSEWVGSGDMPVPPDGTWTFIDVTEQPEAQVGDSFDVDKRGAERFVKPEPKVNRVLTKVQLLSLITPELWSALNQYHPRQPEPWNNANVYWAVTMIREMEVFDLDTELVQRIFQYLDFDMDKMLTAAARV